LDKKSCKYSFLKHSSFSVIRELERHPWQHTTLSLNIGYSKAPIKLQESDADEKFPFLAIEELNPAEQCHRRHYPQ